MRKRICKWKHEDNSVALTGNVYYLDVINGSDSNMGLKSTNAFKTLAYAESVMNNGDVLLTGIEDGSYPTATKTQFFRYKLNDILYNGNVLPYTNRVISEWSNVGVPGGIAQYRAGGANARTLGANVVSYGADNTGISDSTSAFQDALAATSSGEYVYVPDGTYLISGAMSAKSGVTWRGQSVSGTIINLDDTPFLTMSGDWPYVQPTLNVTAGATKGSTVLTVNDSSSIVIGKHVLLSQLSPDYCHANDGNGWSVAGWVGHGADRLMTIMFLVEDKNDGNNTVTLDHPLPIDMLDTPMLTVFQTTPKSGIGVEEITFDATNSNQSRILYFSQATGCWAYKVYFKNPYSRTFWAQESTNLTVEGCYSENGRSSGSNSEGMDFYDNACWCLVQNNIFISCGYPMLMFGDWQGGCAGNVVAYNYQYGENQLANSTSSGPVSMADSHGPIVMFTLWEGNYMEIISADGYWGSSCYGTIFRNRISGVTGAVPTYLDQCAIVLNHWSDYYSIVGNILGTFGTSTVYEASGGGFQNPQIYRLGYPNMGNRNYSGSSSNPSQSNYIDTFVEESLIRHGNYDYVNESVIWESGYSQVLENSLFLDSAPSWWGSCEWPAIGPDVDGYATDIPAKVRWDAYQISEDVSDLFPI